MSPIIYRTAITNIYTTTSVIKSSRIQHSIQTCRKIVNPKMRHRPSPIIISVMTMHTQVSKLKQPAAVEERHRRGHLAEILLGRVQLRGLVPDLCHDCPTRLEEEHY